MIPARNRTGYSSLSIMLHWLTAIAVIALFLTHEGRPGSTAMDFHIGAGAIIGIFLMWRVARRARLGMTQKPAQAEAFNLLSHVVLWGMMLAIAVAVVTGYLLPWMLGRPLDIYGFAIPSPFRPQLRLHQSVESIHSIAGQLIVPLLGLHLLGAAKHVLFDADRWLVLKRMVKRVDRGL